MIINQSLQLIEGCIKRDHRSQKLLYQEFYSFAMAICLRYTGNRYEASEILNEGFFKAFINIERYDKSRSFKAWLSKIMHHASIDYYRANLRTAVMEDIEKADYQEIDAVVEQKLDYEDLLRMVQGLSPAYRMVFNLSVIDGYSHEEIAEMLKISASTSRSNLLKARQKLQQMISISIKRSNGNNFYNLKMTSISQSAIDKLFNNNFWLK